MGFRDSGQITRLFVNFSHPMGIQCFDCKREISYFLQLQNRELLTSQVN